MNLLTTDLNLLVALDALLTERNVTRAGARIGLSQPAMSAALGRLRRQFADDLLVRVGTKYELTPLALVLADRVREVLRAVEQTLIAAPVFDPATSQREFTVITSDYAMTVLAGRLVPALRELAPDVRLRVELVSPSVLDDPEEALNRVDVLLIPRGHLSGFPGVDLFEDEWVCVTGGIGEGEDVDPRSARWARVFAATGATAADKAFDSLVLGARVDVVVDAFVTLPLVVRGTDLHALVQRRLIEPFVRTGDLRLIPLTVALPPLQEAAWWHPRKEDDPGHRWFRGLVQRVATSLDGATGDPPEGAKPQRPRLVG